jgi:hypothetical protein
MCIINKRIRKPMGQSRMDNPDTLTTQGTQDTTRWQTTQSTQDTNDDKQHTAHKTQNDDKQHKRTQHSKLKRGATGTSPKKTVVNPHAREG